jgi:methionyl-tRNA formyltransferase
MKPSIIFFGNERLATGLATTVPITFQRLVEHGYDIAAVVTPFTPGRSRTARPLEIEAAAQAEHIPVIKPPNKQSLLPLIAPYRAQIGVLVAFGMIIPPEVIAGFESGIINLHPSLLPHYRGPTPIEQTILDGATETGVSIMQLGQGMDSGPVLAQQTVGVSSHESKARLASRLQELGARLIVGEVAKVLEGTAHPHSQDNSQATFCTPLAKSDGIIDWAQPAVQLEREVRAFLGWPGSRTTLWGQEITITAAAVAAVDEPAAAKPGIIIEGYPRRLLVATGAGVLELLHLKPAGKRAMDAAAFLRGRR